MLLPAAFHHNFICSVVLVVFYVHFYLFVCAVMIDFPSTSLQKHMGLFQNQKFFRTAEMNSDIPAGLESLKIEFVSEKLNFTFHCGEKTRRFIWIAQAFNKQRQNTILEQVHGFKENRRALFFIVKNELCRP